MKGRDQHFCWGEGRGQQVLRQGGQQNMVTGNGLLNSEEERKRAGRWAKRTPERNETEKKGFEWISVRPRSLELISKAIAASGVF